MPGKAVHVADVSSDFRGDAHVFRLDPPLSALDKKLYSDVIVASIISRGADPGPETSIFAAKRRLRRFKVSDWGSLRGPIEGTLDVAEALRIAGYDEIVW